LLFPSDRAFACPVGPSRLRAAMTACGIDKKLPFRNLFVLRNAEFPSGRVTNELKAKFLADGGMRVAMTEDDLRTFIALRELYRSKPDGFLAWLQTTKPLCKTRFFQSIGLCPLPLSATAPLTAQTTHVDVEASPVAVKNPASPIPALARSSGPPPAAKATPREPSTVGAVQNGAAIPVGHRLEGGVEGRTEMLPANLLTRHTAIFAGSGSGKTVLLRRIVEEAALLGIPAIVLDTNNDLARLGEAWPTRPTGVPGR
jgi:Helicase HerA, central domain